MTRPAAPLSVLVVEDEALLAMDMELMIEESGHRVVAEAASLRDVEQLSLDPAPHLAFVDVHLAHGSSGIDVCRLIQQRWREAIVVFVTANPAKVQAGDCHHHGIIPKPFSRNGLMAAMRYIGEGITDPPPIAPRPTSFQEAPAFAGTWQA